MPRLDSGSPGGPSYGPDPEALERALRFIDYRPRSSGETRRRLRRYGYDAATIETVIDHLTVAGILDDTDFARLFMAELLGKGVGFYRVRSELVKKMVPREVIDELTVDYLMEDELERAKSAAERRLGTFDGDPSDPAVRKKLADYLVRRGFARQVAQTAARLTLRVDTQTSPELE